VQAGAYAAGERVRQLRDRGVKSVDFGGILCVDWLALQFHRWRQLVAAWLPRSRQHLELLDLFDAR